MQLDDAAIVIVEDTLVIAVAADTFVKSMSRAEASSFDGFIGKPLNPDVFAAQISRALDSESVWDCG